MAVNGIFQNGVWSCGFGFVNTGGSVNQIFDSSTGGSAVFSSSGTRFGSGNRLGLSGASATKNLNANISTLIEGFAFQDQENPASGWALFKEWLDAGTVQVSLQVNSLGQLQFFQGSGTSTPLGPASAAGTIVGNVYAFLETAITFNGAGGSVALRLNGAVNPIISASGLNTAPSGNNQVNQTAFLSTGFPGGFSATSFSDWYMLDTTGPSPLNTFLGNIRILTSGPSADSATSGLNTWAVTTPQGTDYGNFANNPANTSDYNSSNTVGARASCKFPSITASRVYFFNCWEQDELDASGTRTIAVTYRNNLIDQVGPTITPSNGTYAYHSTASATDPNTGAPWANGLVSNSNNLEIGPVVIS